MVFALETYCSAKDGYSAARIEEEVVRRSPNLKRSRRKGRHLSLSRKVAGTRCRVQRSTSSCNDHVELFATDIGHLSDLVRQLEIHTDINFTFNVLLFSLISVRVRTSLFSS